MTDIRVDVVLSELEDNSVFIRRIENYLRQIDGLKVQFTSEPVADGETDCYVAPCNRISEIRHPTNRPVRWKPIVAFGAASELRNAFLDGCTDYIKSPWKPEELYYRVLRICSDRIHRFSWGTIELDGLTALVRLEIYPPDSSAVIDSDPELSSYPNIGFQKIPLGAGQAKILDTLLTLRGSVVSRGLLYYALWEREGDGSRAVDMQIHALRDLFSKVSSELSGNSFIRGVYGEGYIID